MKWFGPTWDAPVNELTEEVPTPEGACIYCLDPIVKGERGLLLPTPDGEQPVHAHCLIKWVLGK